MLEQTRRKAMLCVINTTFALTLQYHPAVRAAFQEGLNCLQAQGCFMFGPWREFPSLNRAPL